MSCLVFGVGVFWCALFVLFAFFVWFVLFLMGLLTGLCIGPLPALLRLSTDRRPCMIIYNFIFLLRLNVCNDLAKAMKALDGKKTTNHHANHPCVNHQQDQNFPMFPPLQKGNQQQDYGVFHAYDLLS